ncbi:Fc receptor, IgG, high affinity I S homeolog isoform X3 [Xenopus laevis]|uniref:Fc receptor, IgG, high affinity I S homeolog isoform X3 n=1 Tax=Xenopus laevis TaxID=8355 RepID=A0A8J1LLF3_XENLA|nr:Fc receptor, IgG, high affinity I S homeolog isoform X3 [Xenopus laevis]
MSPLVAVILITVTIESKGAAVKPVVSFNPNWGTVLAYESVTLTCNVAPPAQREQKYHWYRNNRNLTINDQSFTVNYAEEKDIGDYQCRAGNGDISEAVRLEVSGAHVILQVPPLVFEGDILSLRCHSYDKFPAVETTFYKDHKEIKSLGTASELLVGKVNMETSGLYKCSRRIKSHSSFHNYSDQVDIVVQEMFSLPQIKVRPDQVSEGDNMTITCDTKLSPHRETTELQFAFYRNGHNVQGFSSSNQYGVPSAQLEHSGNYACEVQTPTGSVKKMSNGQQIKLHGGGHVYRAVIISVALLSILLVAAALTYKYRHNLALPLACNGLLHQKQGSDSSTALVRLPNEEADRPENENLSASQESLKYSNLSTFPVPFTNLTTEDICYSHINTGQLHKVYPSATYRPDDCSVIYCVVKPMESQENTAVQPSDC